MDANKKAKKVRFFEAYCEDCHKTFAVPLLSDFVYGGLIFNSEDGKAFAYIDALADLSFDFISKTLKRFAKDKENRELRKGYYGFLSTWWAKIKPRRDEDYYLTDTYINRVQWTIAHCADEINGQKLTSHFICPSCHSKNVIYGNAIVIKDDEIPIVTFNTFNTMSESEKIDKIYETYHISKTFLGS